jgi:hypothetical protein
MTIKTKWKKLIISIRRKWKRYKRRYPYYKHQVVVVEVEVHL